MFEQGCSRLAPNESGRILDRISGLAKVISQEAITAALSASNKQSRHRWHSTVCS